MAPRKTKKVKKSTRAVSGRILPPINITNASQLGELDKRLAMGPITLVFVYADWCGHCQRFKPNMEQLEGLNNRSVQIARVRDDVFPKTSINKTPIEGYPSLLLIDKNKNAVMFEKEDGEVTTVIPEHNNMQNMASIVVNAGTPEGMQVINKANNLKPTALNKVKVTNKNGTPVVSAVEEEEEEPPPIAVKNTANYMNLKKTPNNNISPEKLQNNSSNSSTGSTITYTPLQPSKTPPSPPNITLDRITANKISVAKNLVESASTPISEEGKKQQGGSYGLLNMLTKVAYHYGPAAALLYMANVKAGDSKATAKKSRKTRRRK